jgi:hypothetical protein
MDNKETEATMRTQDTGKRQTPHRHNTDIMQKEDQHRPHHTTRVSVVNGHFVNT